MQEVTVFVISDQHLFHENILKFKAPDGVNLMRPGFDSIEHMHEVIVQRHNAVVESTSDKVYFLGDVTMKYGEPFRLLMGRLKGRKRLVLGNHDKIKGTNLANAFEKITLWKTFGEGFVFSHVPLRAESFPGKAILNVHGHVHLKTLMTPERPTIPDARYMNVSCEAVNYTPVSVDDIMKRVEKLR